jgi:hypothetical protein
LTFFLVADTPIKKKVCIVLFLIFCLFSSRHLKDNLYISYAGIYIPKYSVWKKDFNRAIAAMRAGQYMFGLTAK